MMLATDCINNRRQCQQLERGRLLLSSDAAVALCAAGIQGDEDRLHQQHKTLSADLAWNALPG